MSEVHSDTPFVFVSYSHEDRNFVTRLRTDLQAHGIEVWVDKEGIQAGTPDWEQALRDAIHTAHAVLFIASPDARNSRYVKDELRIAEYYQRVVYPLWVAGNQWIEAVPIGLGSVQYIDVRESRYQTALPEIVQTIQRTFKEITASLPPGPSTDFEPRNPYKGLLAFRIEDAGDFFGRTRLVHELVQSVQQMLATERQDEASSRLLTVIGASGSGKSSVVMAGLLYQLQQGALPASRDWLYLDPMVPGKHPLEALTLTLSRHFPARSLASIAEDLQADSTRGLHLLMTSLVKRPDTKAVLFIDQFEELFTQTSSEDERRHFLAILISAITEPGGSVIALLTLRADFYDRPLRYPEIGRLIEARRVVMFALEMTDFREVIEQPARLPDVQLTFEADLVGDLLFDVQGQSGALPLLQFTLDQLFQRRQGHLLTRQAYEELGGIKGALAQHAETTYLSLPSEDHRRLARALFLRLVDAGTLEQDATRRRAPLSELTLTDANEMILLHEVVRTFTAARLLTTNTITGTATVEVSHEALISKWARLHNWLGEAYEDIRLQKKLSEDVAAWIHVGKPADRLYRGSQLVEAQVWRTQNIPSQDEEAFLQASAAEQEREKAAEKQKQRRYTRRVVLVGIGGLGLVAAAIPLTRYFFPSSSASRPSFQTVTYRGHSSLVDSAAWSPDGKYIASASNDQSVQVWEALTARRVQTYRGHTGSVISAAWSPDGKYIASAGVDATVQVWEALSARHVQSYKGVFSAAWSPDGKYIASASLDTTVQVWEALSARRVQTYRGHSDWVHSAAWSPDGKYIASASDDKTVVISAAWSPDGKYIASASADTTVQVWLVLLS